MKDLNLAVQELEDIVQSNLDNLALPYKKGNSIRVGYIIIRKSKNFGYIVFDSKNNKCITNTFSIAAALAVAKAATKKTPIYNILKYDSIIEKNYNDSQFYSHIINGGASETRKNAIASRLEIATTRMDAAKTALDKFIMKDL
jgi:hypothetical protein